MPKNCPINKFKITLILLKITNKFIMKILDKISSNLQKYSYRMTKMEKKREEIKEKEKRKLQSVLINLVIIVQ